MVVAMDIKYFDNAATTSVKKEVLQEMLPYLKEKYGKPGNVYLALIHRLDRPVRRSYGIC